MERKIKDLKDKHSKRYMKIVKLKNSWLNGNHYLTIAVNDEALLYLLAINNELDK